jgi:hypothetical protein
MTAKLVSENAGQRTDVVVLDAGEEALTAITAFAARENLRGAAVTALGAFERATVGWFDLHAKRYREIPVEQQCEVLSAIGGIAEGDDGKPSLHLHVVLGLRDGSTRRGHLLRAVVRPTVELTVVEAPAHPRRKHRSDLGIASIALA